MSGEGSEHSHVCDSLKTMIPLSASFLRSSTGIKCTRWADWAVGMFHPVCYEDTRFHFYKAKWVAIHQTLFIFFDLSVVYNLLQSYDGIIHFSSLRITLRREIDVTSTYFPYQRIMPRYFYGVQI